MSNKPTFSTAFLRSLEIDRDENKHLLTASGKQKSPNVVRGEIRRFLASSTVTQTAWLKSIGVNSGSYSRFMGPYKDQWSACQNQCYELCAWEIYKHKKKEKELARMEKEAEKERKKAEKERMKAEKEAAKKNPTLLPSSGTKRSANEANFVDLTGDVPSSSSSSSSSSSAPLAKRAKTMTKKERTKELLAKVSEVDVPYGCAVYDNCDIIRRKTNHFLSSYDIVKKDWLDYMNLNSGSLSVFMNYSGKGAGAGNSAYPALYRFFEQLRIADGKPKTKIRLENEVRWGAEGYRLRHDDGGRYVPINAPPIKPDIDRERDAMLRYRAGLANKKLS